MILRSLALLFGGILILCSVGGPGHATPCDVFMRAFGSTEDEVANCVRVTADGSYVVTGYRTRTNGGRDLLLAKLDPSGDLLWKRVIGGAGDDEGRSLVVTEDGDYLVVGYTRSYGSGGADCLICKFSSGGTPRWIRTWGGSEDDQLAAVISTLGGRVFATGFTNSYDPVGRSKILLAEVRATGDSLVCCRAYEEIGFWDLAGSGLESLPGVVIVTGGVNAPLIGGTDLLVMVATMDPLMFISGDRYGLTNENESGRSVLVTSDAGLAVVGSSHFVSGPVEGERAILLKLDASLNPVWARTAGGGFPYTAYLGNALETSDHRLLVGGGFVDPLIHDSALLASFTLAGTVVWTRGFEDVRPECLQEKDDGQLVLTGATDIFGSGGLDFVLGETNPYGQTCLPEVSGPQFQSWSPRHEAVSSWFATEVVPTRAWNVPSWIVPTYPTNICPRVRTVCPDGHAEFTLIQDALDAAAACDTVELCDDWTFTGDRNRDLDFRGKQICLRSHSGDPARCIIDVRGGGHRGIYFHSGDESEAVVEGITIRRGGPYSEIDRGGGILCEGVSPTIQNCRFELCDGLEGGAIYCSQASSRITGCSFENNYASNIGGGLCCFNSSPVIDRCTFADNEAGQGGGVYGFHSILGIAQTTFTNNGADFGGGIACIEQSAATVSHSIVAFGTRGEAVMCGSGSSATLDCCDLFGNAGGDWVGYVQGQLGQAGNIGEDPLFCWGASQISPYTVHSDSPCGPDHNPVCGLIGAWSVDCSASGIAEDPIRHSFECRSPAPNPFRSVAAISYTIPPGGGGLPVFLGVYDAGGRLVRTLVDNAIPPGGHAIVWDGRSDGGDPVPSGIYFFRLQWNGQALRRTVLRLR